MWSALIGAGASLAGGALNAITRKQAGDREYARQQEFAQNGIRWRVEDAKAAGIHPIFAVGANTPTYSPQAAVGSDFGLSYDMGQNIGRAIEAKQTADERAEAANVSNQVGRAQAEYYNAAAANQRAQADLAGQRAVAEAISDIGREFTGGMAARSDRILRNQPGQPPAIPRSDEVSTYNKPKPGIDPYIIGNTYFEAPPENIADMVENPALFAGWKGVIEAAEVLDGKVKQDFMRILLPSHRKLINAGTHEIIRVRGIGFAVKRKGDPLKPSDFGLNSRAHHVGGPNNIY